MHGVAATFMMLLANDTDRRIGWGSMAGASPATTMIRVRRLAKPSHGSGTPCGCHARFLARIDEPEKNWKFSASDARERRYWDDYQRAYEELLSNTSTSWAPWYVIPADRKWFSRLAVAVVILHALMEIDPQYPEVSLVQKQELAKAKMELEAEES